MSTPSTTLRSDGTLARQSSKARRRPLLLVVAAAGVVAYTVYRPWHSVRYYEWSGTVEARSIEVGSRQGGRVKEVLVREGERVRAKQPLVLLETGELEAQRQMAEAELEQARAVFERLRRGARPEEIEQAHERARNAAAALAEAERGARGEEIGAAKARLAAAQVAVEQAELEGARTKHLLASGAVARAFADEADAQLRAATAARDEAQEKLNELANGVGREQLAQASSRAREAVAGAKLVTSGARAEDIEIAEAHVKFAAGKLELAEVMLRELTVVASKDARVEAIDLRPGDILTPNATAAILLEEDQIYVRMYVPETQLGHVHTGDRVPIFVDSFPDRPFYGVVESIDGEGQYLPRNLSTADERANQVFAARVALREPAPDLRPGMAAVVRLPE